MISVDNLFCDVVGGQGVGTVLPGLSLGYIVRGCGAPPARAKGQVLEGEAEGQRLQA